MTLRHFLRYGWFCAGLSAAFSLQAAPAGVVIDYSPASSGLYIGSPSLVVTTNGVYLASHDLFGPKSEEFSCPKTRMFRSADRGATWTKATELDCLFWANLFVHRGMAYIMGTDKHHGRIVIRKSEDAGQTWTEPRDGATGLLTASGEYHTAPMPVVQHQGRLWRAFEDASAGKEWGKRYRAFMLSIPEEADLLNATNWTFSNALTRDPGWLSGQFNAWLEGNAVIARDGRVLDILRVDTPTLPERAAIVEISSDGKRASFDPARDFTLFPGGAKKFVIRFDPKSDAYWSLATIVSESSTNKPPSKIRNTLALTRSTDLRKWEVRAVLLQHPDTSKHGFQYADWQFDSDSMIAVVRTAFDDDEGGAHNHHDANFMTFHRIEKFRDLTDQQIGDKRAQPGKSR
jgi:hypothetical protein